MAYLTEFQCKPLSPHRICSLLHTLAAGLTHGTQEYQGQVQIGAGHGTTFLSHYHAADLF